MSPSSAVEEFLDDQSIEKHTTADLRLKPKPDFNLSQKEKPVGQMGMEDVILGR